MESKHRATQGLYPELVVLCQPPPAHCQFSQPLGSSGDASRAVTLITGIYPRCTEGYGTARQARRDAEDALGAGAVLGLVLPHPATWPGAGLSHTGQVRHPQPQGNPRRARRGVRAAAGVRQETSPTPTAPRCGTPGHAGSIRLGPPPQGQSMARVPPLPCVFSWSGASCFPPKVRCWFLGLSWRRAGREDTSLWGWHCRGDEVVLQDQLRDVGSGSQEGHLCHW